jgi:hypothetical protein
LINKAIEKYPSPTYALCGFRKFNLDNSVDTQIYALEKRIRNWWQKDVNLGRKKVIIFCYLLKGKDLSISSRVLDPLKETFPTFTLICEADLQDEKQPSQENTPLDILVPLLEIGVGVFQPPVIEAVPRGQNT